jgi:ABC-type branched-subunit amino acid transport system substrate-binding protein
MSRQARTIAASFIFTCLAVAFAAPAGAEDGITSDTILIGQSAVLSGPLGGLAQENNRAALAYFEQVNAAGGIFGRKVKLVSLDDELKPDKAVANYKQLIDETRVFATFAGVGTGTTAAIIPLLNERRVPLIGPLGVGDSVRAIPTRQVYYLRAGYQEESAKLVSHITALGQREIGLATLNNPGGKEVLSLVQAQLDKQNLKLKASGLLDNDGGNMPAVARQLAGQAPQAVLLFAGGKLAADFIKALFDNGYVGQVFCYSVASGELVARVVGERARGVGFAQVVQYPWDTSVKVAKEYQQIAAASKSPVTYNGMGGHLAARLFVEAMRRAGKDPTREKLRAALESAPFDLGGVTMIFSPEEHLGSRYVELVMLTRDARFVR